MRMTGYWAGCAVALALASASCGSDATPAPRFEQLMGPAGGTIRTTDGTTLEVPPGALTQTTRLAIQASPNAAAPPGVTPVGPVYHFEPDNMVFQIPVTIRLAWSASALPPARTRDDIQVYTAPTTTASYVLLGAGVVDDHNVSVAVTHFSVYVAGVTTPAGPGMPDSTCVPAGMDRIAGDACGTCVVAHCNDLYKMCYGSAWQQGDYSGGFCGPYDTCVCQCAKDKKCIAACRASSDCSQNCGAPEEACARNNCAAECAGVMM